MFLIFALFATIRIGIVTDAYYCGEREVAWRIKRAAESLGWHAILDENKGRNIRRREDLDWVICLLPSNRYHNQFCNNYLTIFHPFNYLDFEGHLKSFYNKYDGYLLTIQNSSLFKNREKESHCIQFYPTTQTIPYERVSLQELVTTLPAWSNRKSDTKYRQLYSLLGKSGFTKFYGLDPDPELLQAGYMGTLPFDGISVIRALQRHGITLILHSDIHNSVGIPSPRIFEAAAASTAIISDENSFVKEQFGDSVFYIDVSLPAEAIYKQIQNHMTSILADPEKALEMAARAHQIFVDHFLMTDQLLQLEAMHQKIQQSKENDS